MTCEAFIDDGYTEKQMIKGIEGLYPSVWVTFRPLASSDVSQWSQECDHKDGVELKKVTARWMNDHIVGWDLEKPIEVENILKLKPGLFDRIFNLLWGYAAGDAMENDLKNSQEG